jgi:hypothetical protein
MTFARACREADTKQRRRPKDPRILPQRAAASTIEALMFSLRSGTGALGQPDTLRRLGELSDTQIREVAVRVQKFKPQIIAPAWTAEDVRMLLAARSKVHGGQNR